MLSIQVTLHFPIGGKTHTHIFSTDIVDFQIYIKGQPVILLLFFIAVGKFIDTFRMLSKHNTLLQL